MSKLRSQYYILKTKFLWLVCILCGVVLAAGSFFLPSSFTFSKTLVNEFATAFFVFAIWELTHKLTHEEFTRETIKSTMAETLATHSKLATDAADIGLEQLGEPSIEFTSAVIKDSKKCVIVLNSGSRWITKFEDALKVRLSDADKETEIFLIDPDSVRADCSILRSLDISQKDYRSSIEAAFRELGQIGKNCNLKIYLHSHLGSNFVCIGDESGIFSPKLLSTTLGRAPVFRFGNAPNKSFVKKLKNELEHLKSNSKLKPFDDDESEL